MQDWFLEYRECLISRHWKREICTRILKGSVAPPFHVPRHSPIFMYSSLHVLDFCSCILQSLFWYLTLCPLNKSLVFLVTGKHVRIVERSPYDTVDFKQILTDYQNKEFLDGMKNAIFDIISCKFSTFLACISNF